VPLLTRLNDPVEAHLLREALAAAGVAAQVRDEFAPVMAGGVSVWVAEEADLPAARAVLEEFHGPWQEDEMTTALTVPRPVEGDCAPYFFTYVNEVAADEDVLAVLADLDRTTPALLAPVVAELAGFRYAPGKWSVREIVGHLADSERVFAYRALTIARGDRTALPAFEENEWAQVSNADSRSLADLVGELRAVRAATLALFRSFGAAEWERTGTASGKALTVRALPYIIAGHERHHVAVLRERYGIG
jgi:hypothetical protein